MSFAAYLENIQKKTGKSIQELSKIAESKGFLENGKLKNGVKAGQIVDWLKSEYELGHGHCMAVFAYFKGKKD